MTVSLVAMGLACLVIGIVLGCGFMIMTDDLGE